MTAYICTARITLKYLDGFEVLSGALEKVLRRSNCNQTEAPAGAEDDRRRQKKTGGGWRTSGMTKTRLCRSYISTHFAVYLEVPRSASRLLEVLRGG